MDDTMLVLFSMTVQFHAYRWRHRFKKPETILVSLREKRFKKSNRPEMSPLRGFRWEGSGSGTRDGTTI